MKYIRYLFLILVSLIWLAGLNPGFYEKLGSWNLFQDGYQYGDLYRLSNLPQFRDPQTKCPAYQAPKIETNGRKVHLYVIGDSFTEEQRVSKNDFAADTYQYVHWDSFLHLKIDTSAINILLLESVERHFREKLASPVRNIIPDSATFVTSTGARSLIRKLDQSFASKPTEGRLESLLFQNDLILWLKERKAAFNYHFFGRVSKEVTLINQDRDIVYYMDTDTPHITSSFSPVSRSQIDSIVQNLNQSQHIARQLGFDHMLLSVIPNKISVLMPTYGSYNNLISRVYTHPALTVPYIDVLQDYRSLGRNSYLKGDSHWTCEGQQIWLRKINALIGQVSVESSVLGTSPVILPTVRP